MFLSYFSFFITFINNIFVNSYIILYYKFLSVNCLSFSCHFKKKLFNLNLVYHQWYQYCCVFLIQEVENSLVNYAKLRRLGESPKISPPTYFYFSIFMYSLQYPWVPNKCYPPPPNLPYYHFSYFFGFPPTLPQCIFGPLCLLIWTTVFVLRGAEKWL